MSSTLKYIAWLTLLVSALSLSGFSWSSLRSNFLSYHGEHSHRGSGDWGAPD